MNKKDQGLIEKLLPVLISTGMVFGLVLLSGQLMEVLRTREAMSQTARAYLLEMETIGYLSGDASAILQSELQEKCGLTDINLSGTTTLPVTYGERIQLVIEGNMKRNWKMQIPFIYQDVKEWNIPVHIHMISTAKH